NTVASALSQATQYADDAVSSAQSQLQSSLTNHTNATSAHGATSNPEPNRILIRDSGGRAKFADPVDDMDAATKGWVLRNGQIWAVPSNAVLAEALTERSYRIDYSGTVVLKRFRVG